MRIGEPGAEGLVALGRSYPVRFGSGPEIDQGRVVRKRTVLRAGLLSAALSLACAGSATAYTTNGVAASDYATGFAQPGGVGPLGLGFDQSNTLFAIGHDGFLYKFSGPGVASAATQVAKIPGVPAGLAFDPQGHLFVARASARDVVQVNKSTGAIVRTVASNLKCPLGLAAEATGDLLLSQGSCQSGLVRITDPTSATPSQSQIAPSVGRVDGVAVAPDGSIFVAADDHNIIRVTGSTATTLVSLPGADGIAIADQGKAQFIIVARNDGFVTRVDLTSPVTTTDLISGASRGDFVAVDNNHCVFPDQSDRILRITNPDGSCTTATGGDTPAGGLGGGLFPTTPASDSLGLPSNGHCIDTRKFRFRLHHAKRARVVKATVLINGKVKKRVHGHAIETLTLKALPQRKFTVRIIAVQNTGSRLVSTRTYRGCKKTRPKTHGHHHRRK
jgi:hypothetical protein